ncbi:MAG TPA: GNAT family N-acetyltransferase [Caulobacterales bacterium]|nr:GNAT family N-acetyltransferase [Caulobacterales bacterium]
MDRYAVKTRADSSELKKAAMAIEQSAWNALGFLNFTRAHFAHYEHLLEKYADHQICLIDRETGYPVAVGTCAPFYRDAEALPDEGWDWVVESASRNGRAPNTLGGLGISVPQVHRSKGLARRVIAAMRDLAIAKGYESVVIPVRPTSKSRHPEVPMEDYLSWQDDRGRAYDPWLRSHLAAGGRAMGPCKRSMVVEEPLAFWEAWTGQRFEQSGAYSIPGGLTPLIVDTREQMGRYHEPNVWFRYAC